MRVRTTIAEAIGFVRGKITRRNIWGTFAPSIRAASSSSLGMPS